MATTTAIQKLSPLDASPGRPFNTLACLLATDVLTLLLSVSLSVVCKLSFGENVNLASYLRLWPFLFVFLAVYAVVGLYSGVALSPPDELRRATWSSTLVFILLGATTVSFRGATNYVTWTLLLAMALSVVLLPLLRALAREAFARDSWWGAPAVVFGSGPGSHRVIRTLLADPGIGLKPVAVVDDSPDKPRAIQGIPVISSFDVPSFLQESEKSAYAIATMPEIRGDHFLSDIERRGFHFSHILVIPNVLNFWSLWVNPKSVGGMLGLEVCRQILVPERKLAKRILDLILTGVGGIICLPLLALIALWIKWDSPGPVFYSQRRIGYGGRDFRAWKFRSMVSGADRVLEKHLSQNARLREEWQRTHKLRNDPRLTRVGRWLRQTSLDELPQLWNVWKGEMSLVGPRPIVDAEVFRYGDGFGLYTKVKGGLTGLWQVSGRTDTSYAERVQLDEYYVRNWSVWLDLCILFRTIGVVLLRKGAY